ncbi:unnamed protein product, partial [Symbiodinium pilosum]
MWGGPDGPEPPLPCNNPFDMLTESGMALLMVTILKMRPRSVAHFGLQCSTWSIMSRGSTLRTFLAPHGDTSKIGVQSGNKMVSRFCLLAILMSALQISWTLEQPSNSLMNRHKRFRQLAKSLYVRKVQFWMKKWGSSTPKRTVVYSNDASIVRFQTSKLTKEQRKGCRQLVKRSIGKDGKPKFSGNKFLKRSEQYPLGFALRYLQIFEELATNDEHRRVEHK